MVLNRVPVGDFFNTGIEDLKTGFQLILCLITYDVSCGVICETMEYPLATPEYETATATAATTATPPTTAPTMIHVVESCLSS